MLRDKVVEVKDQVAEESSTPDKMSNEQEKVRRRQDEEIGENVLLPEGKPVAGKSYEIEEGIMVTEQEDGSYLLNQEFSRSDLDKGKKLAER